MKSIEIDTRIEGGQFRQNKDFIRDAIKEFEGKEIQIIFKRKYKKRSAEQNSFYWGVWVPIIQRAIRDTWGEFKSPSEIHEILKTNCNYDEKVNENTGEFIKVSKSSTDLNTYEWESEFKDKIQQFVLEWFNVVLPIPDEQLKINY